jgi:Gluconate 2-dehydrogenase subunit 3
MNQAARMPRREAIKWVLAASATISALDARSFGASPASATGYGTDPDLMQVYKPGALWPLTFTPEQRRTAAALCDVILPADEKSPSASKLKVPDFIDEWISAPYPRQKADRQEILEGLAWLEKQSRSRFHLSFIALTEDQKRQICDQICSLQKCGPDLKSPARFFAKFRNLTMAGFYTTPEGMKDIQYLGNVPSTRFDGPPPEVLAYLKLS